MIIIRQLRRRPWPLRSLARRLFPVLVLVALVAGALPARAADSAVVLIYHRFGEDAHPSTNVRLEQFERQIALLREGGFTVLPLAEIVTSIRSGLSTATSGPGTLSSTMSSRGAILSLGVSRSVVAKPFLALAKM